MSSQPTAASQWRIELAKELIGFYVPHDGIEMAVLSGSPPKGLSDEFSDLDVIVFWNEIDVEWLEADPLRDVDCERKYFRRMGELDIYLESQYFGALKVDFGHVRLALWKETVDDVLEHFDTDPSNLDSLAGFSTALPLYGDEKVAEWKERIAAYPDELAKKIVRSARRFYVPGYLVNQAHGRGEALAYQDGICRMLKNLLSILAGLNRVYFSTDEPRWVEYYLDKMPIKPDGTWERMKAVLAGDGADAVAILEGLMEEVLDLIEEHMPEFKDGYRGRWRGMTVAGRRDKPEIRRTG